MSAEGREATAREGGAPLHFPAQNDPKCKSSDREALWRCEQHPDLTPGERFPSDGGGPYCLACSSGREATRCVCPLPEGTWAPEPTCPKHGGVDRAATW